MLEGSWVAPEGSMNPEQRAERIARMRVGRGLKARA
jgi:hypothetical protein